MSSRETQWLEQGYDVEMRGTDPRAFHRASPLNQGDVPYLPPWISLCIKLGTLIGFHVNTFKVTRTVPNTQEIGCPMAILENKKPGLPPWFCHFFVWISAFLSEKNMVIWIFTSHYERLKRCYFLQKAFLSIHYCLSTAHGPTSRSLLSWAIFTCLLTHIPVWDCKFTLARNCFFHHWLVLTLICWRNLEMEGRKEGKEGERGRRDDRWLIWPCHS